MRKGVQAVIDWKGAQPIWEKLEPRPGLNFGLANPRNERKRGRPRDVKGRFAKKELKSHPDIQAGCTCRVCKDLRRAGFKTGAPTPGQVLPAKKIQGFAPAEAFKLFDGPAPAPAPAKPKKQQISYSLVWLEANRRYGLRKKLGNGIAREGWLTKCGRVFKMPIPTRSLEDYGKDYWDQMGREIEAMERGTLRNGSPMAKGEAVDIFGVKCILMEYVWPVRDALRTIPEEHKWRLPYLHKKGLEAQFQNEWRKTLEQSREVCMMDGVQFGQNKEGKWVCYDAGCE